MAKSLVGVLFEVDEKERTLPLLLDRMKEIKDQLNRAAGVLKSMSVERMERQTQHYVNTLHGWSNKLRSLGIELTIIQLEIAKHLTK